jgi:uncharacterized protein (DUF169 family)
MQRMRDYAALERVLTDVLQLSHRPVAIAFRDTPPDGVTKLEGAQPSGCSFWRLAASGQAFYTVPSDHFNCPLGSYTHNIDLPADRQHELMQVLSLMTNVGYIRMEEVPGIPRLPKTPAATIYAPLGLTPVAPDAVLMAGKPGRLMLLHEASTRAGKNVLPLMGRPTCMAIPAALSGGVASSLGCVGNRVYTSISDDEFYTVIAGKDVEAIVAHLGTMASANAALADFHQSRRTLLSNG